MCIIRFIKGVAVFALIVGGLVVVGIVILGRERVEGIASDAKYKLQRAADKIVGDEADITDELNDLSASYPKRIASTRATLKEAQSQAASIERERERLLDLIGLADRDIKELKSEIEDDDALNIHFHGKAYSESQAADFLAKSSAARAGYAERFNRLAGELDVVQEHIDSLTADLDRLRDEQQRFESEREAILRELDRIAQNERLISLAQDRHKAEPQDASEQASLATIRQKLERKRIEQEEELRALKEEQKPQQTQSPAAIPGT